MEVLSYYASTVNMLPQFSKIAEVLIIYVSIERCHLISKIGFNLSTAMTVMQQWFDEAAVGHDEPQAFLLAVTETAILQGTTTGDKNEILWQHGINYHNLSEQFKKASCRLAKSQQLHSVLCSL